MLRENRSPGPPAEQVPSSMLKQARVSWADLEPLQGEVDGRPQQIRPGQAPETLVQLIEAGQHARDQHRAASRQVPPEVVVAGLSRRHIETRVKRLNPASPRVEI